MNLSTCMIVQSPNQIETLYDKAAADIMDNVHQTIFIGSGGQGEKSATKWMSNALGIKTIQAEQTSVHVSKTMDLFGIDGSTVEHSYNATQRQLMTQDELYRLGVELSVKIDKEQEEQRRRDLEEDEKYDPVPVEPVEPEVKPLQEVLRPDEAEYYDPVEYGDENM